MTPTIGLPRIAVIIPCFRVRDHIIEVLEAIGPEVTHIYVVDDACPDASGEFVATKCRDPRLRVLRRETNGGVGAAVMDGYRRAITDGAEVLVKIDGDGQMDPRLIPHFVAPILMGRSDYTKGNRFYDITNLRRMPAVRLLGNTLLSFVAKFSTGYWNLFDINNGYTALHVRVARHLPFDKISTRYFFESDMLFRLNIIRAVVVDVPMDAKYGGETSHLHIRRILGEFALKHLRNLVKRIVYNYYLRDMTVASLELIAGVLLLTFGVVFGGLEWVRSAGTQTVAPAGTVMLAGLTTLLGTQLLLAFIGFDVANTPRTPVHPLLPDPISTLS